MFWLKKNEYAPEWMKKKKVEKSAWKKELYMWKKKLKNENNVHVKKVRKKQMWKKVRKENQNVYEWKKKCIKENDVQMNVMKKHCETYGQGRMLEKKCEKKEL